MMQPGERVPGNTFTMTILPFLHTGQMQGFIPGSRSIRCGFVSGGCCRFNTASMACFTMVMRWSKKTGQKN